MSNHLPPAIFIMGPTAAGKTDLAVELAQRYPIEIISVDSALVYRQMDIGTAKPSAEVLTRFPHHLVNIVDPTEPYSAGRFRTDALRLMHEITSRGNVPLLVGGTMLYFKALEAGIAELPQGDQTIRNKLDSLVKQHGLQSLHQRLSEVDPVSAQRININDPQRLQRALEIYEITGKTMTELTLNQQAETLNYRICKIILSPFNRKVLHKRIEERYLKMIENGFIDEVRRLFNRDDCYPELPSIRAVGYRQAWSFLAGEYDQNTFIYKAIVATRQMAKRQITWLRAQSDGVWFDSGNDIPIDLVNQFIQDSVPELHNNA